MKAPLFPSCLLWLTAVAATAHAADAKYSPLAYQPICSQGQALVDMEVARHPELKILTLHVTPRDVPVDVDSERRLFFSNIGRVSKVDAGPDGDVYRSDKELIEIEKNPAKPSTNFSITATPKYEVLEILRDKNGARIGLIVMVFPYHENFDLEQYHKVALQVARELNERIASKDSLFDPA
jgi:hypothetical protein